MHVSVIIPVYNAENFVREAVESALAQPETSEVILIEDASSDNSLQICRELAGEFTKVKLLRYSDGNNHGAGASRNLGIETARFDYVAFLDADDFFLPGRFSVAKQLFEEDSQIDGVYEAVGVHFENEAAKRRWRSQRSGMLTTMTERVPPDRLFEAQEPVGRLGYCHTCGWIVKKMIFKKTGLFDEELRLHQDSAMFVKFAAVGKMVAGRLDEPVSIRRVHDHNRILAPRPAFDVYQNHVLMWNILWKWGNIHLNKRRRQILLKRLIDHVAMPSRRTNLRLINHFIAIYQLLLLLIQHPGFCLQYLFWRKCLVAILIWRYI